MMIIGLIGVGMVGSAIQKAVNLTGYKLHCYDKFKKIGSLDNMHVCDVIFVCVPTPTTDGMQDISAIVETLQYLSANNCTGEIVVKSTVLPGTMGQLQHRFPNLKLLHNPEFLTEKNAFEDFMHQPTVLISSESGAHQHTARFYHKLMPAVDVKVYMDFRTTEMAKYIHNTFLATKVAFMNEMYDFCRFHSTDFDLAVDAAATQERIGHTHNRVPGPSGERGFGGACFPKDTEALLNHRWGRKVLTILNRAVESNNALRGYYGHKK